jgi:hypothetical protein
MKKLLLGTALCFALASPALADVTVLDKLSGTGDNVVADSTTSTTSALGHLNGQHLDVVRYTGLTVGFGFAANGNDIKISNVTTLTDQVFDPTNTNVVGTTEEVFSLTGSGDVHLSVNATDGTFTFDLGTIGNGQSGFTVDATNGEVITSLSLNDVGGTITDFEHNRITSAVAAVPEPQTWAMMLLGFVGLGFAFHKRRRKISFA